MKLKIGKLIFMTLSLVIATSPVLSPFVFASDDTEIEKVEAEEAKTPVAHEKWTSEVQAKYSLSDAQVKSLDSAGLKGPHLAFVAALAKESGKSIEEIIQMRTTEKMGWGAIAKKLGVPPGTIGQSVASLRHDIKSKGTEAKKEVHEARKEARKTERAAQKAERKEERSQPKAK